ncbi:MAG TPA: helix-turn-helix transcriptional regulator [Pseudonocardiaceae bacterium]|nr:helix-turn-helix transcriptional regulator [Pseudonocardiaceae bacterium]
MPGPTLSRLLLGKEIRQLREAAGISREQAASALKCSKARIDHIEVGRNAMGYAELVMLLRDHYGAEHRIGELEALRENASQRGWWSTAGLSDWLARYVGLESDATSIRTFELEWIPGLLQTEDYARATYSVDDRWTGRDIDRRVGARMRRQERLRGPDPLRVIAVVSEGALARCARHPSVAQAQLRQLIDRAQWPNIELRVLPFDQGLHVAMGASFSLLSFPDGLLGDVANQEYTVGGDVIEDPVVVSLLDRLFGKLRDQALGPDESLAKIAELATTL